MTLKIGIFLGPLFYHLWQHSTLYVKLRALQSTYVKGLVIPARPRLDPFVRKECVFNNCVIILNVGLGLD